MPHLKPQPRGQRGIALLIVLLSMTLLTVLVMEFTFSTQVEIRRASHWLKSRRASLLAESGVEMAAALLDRYRYDPILNSLLLNVQGQAIPIPIPDEVGTVQVRIDDLNGRLDLNALSTRTVEDRARSRKQRERARLRLEYVLRELDFDRNLTGALIDWVDGNGLVNPTPLGAEELYYSNLEKPYRVRNAPLRSFGELALVKGFEPSILRGLRPSTAVLRSSTSARARFGNDPEATRAKINVNTAPAIVLRAALNTQNPSLDEAILTDRIMVGRKTLPFDDVAALRKIEGMSSFSATSLEEVFRFGPSTFRVLATAEVDGVYQSVEAVLHRDVEGIRVQYWLPRRGPNIPEAEVAFPAEFTALPTSAPPG